MAEVLRLLRVESLETRQLLAALVDPPPLRTCSANWYPAAEEASVAVRADNLHGLRGAEFRFEYDSSVIEIDASNVQAGSAWRGKAGVIANVDDSLGTVGVFVFSTSPIDSSEGELVEFDLDLIDQLAHDAATQIKMTKVELNEGQIGSSFKLVVEQHGRESITQTEANMSPALPAGIARRPVKAGSLSIVNQGGEVAASDLSSAFIGPLVAGGRVRR